MKNFFTLIARRTSLLSTLALSACGDGLGVDELAEALEITPTTIDLAAARDTAIQIHNAGTRAMGPIQLVAGPIMDGGGNVVSGPRVTVAPSVVPTLNPGDTRRVAIGIEVSPETASGAYATYVEARLMDTTVTSVDLRFAVTDALAENIASVVISAPTSTVRQGDVVQLSAAVTDGAGETVPNAQVQWSLSPAGAGLVAGDGGLVAYSPGDLTVIASAGTTADSLQLTVTPRGLAGTFTVVGRGPVSERVSSDLWLHGSAAYQGSWGIRNSAAGTFFGNILRVWDVTDPSTPRQTATVTVDARTVNDVKIRPDGRIGVMTHEGSNDLQNGITLLDLADPLQPTVVARFTQTLETGVHNAWIDDDFVYLVVDGTSPTSGLRILDIREPSDPRIVASFYAGSSFLHDVYVRDGLAFLSHWNAGLVILDVGNGLAGGSPVAPVEVSRLQTQGGQTHNAWYWPDGGFVFVGEEDIATPGIMHVVEVTDLWNPKEVATFTVPGQTPHNFWMDEARQVLYLSWYGNGVRALDVGGRLLGELDRQGREISGILYAASETQSWAPQLHGGLVYVSDMTSGLWVLRPEF